MLDVLRQALPANYSVEAELQAGGQGSVFRGCYRGIPVALKVFNAGVDQRRVQREIELLQQIDCPHLVKVISNDQIRIEGSDLELVAYEFHSAGDLQTILRPEAQTLTEGTLASVGREIGIALDALWMNRIVHRDVKPANIVRAADGSVVLVDVAFARHLDRSTLTAAGFAIGTRGYMSPEQAQGRRNLTIHSDAFSLGITLYEIACKIHPFRRDQRRIIEGILPAPLESQRPDLSPSFCRAIHQLMFPIPANRPKALEMHFAPYAGG